MQSRALRKTRGSTTASRFSKAERRALSVLGLGEDADLHALRQRYSALVRRYHPDKNGGDRSHEGRLGEVIEAYQLLRKARPSLSRGPALQAGSRGAIRPCFLDCAGTCGWASSRAR